jgi:hypothetical protein
VWLESSDGGNLIGELPDISVTHGAHGNEIHRLSNRLTAPTETLVSFVSER